MYSARGVHDMSASYFVVKIVLEFPASPYDNCVADPISR